MASTSNKHIVQYFQSKVLRMIVDAPWYMPNTDLQTPTVKEETRHYISQYIARPSVHPNNPVMNLMAQPTTTSLNTLLAPVYTQTTQ
jgi:hypothetical protein